MRLRPSNKRRLFQIKDQRPRAPASVDNIGIGVAQVPEFFSGMPKILSDIFAGNPVAGVFVISMILSLTLPKKVKMEDVGALTEDTIDSKKPE